jgi:hypothetical protein
MHILDLLLSSMFAERAISRHFLDLEVRCSALTLQYGHACHLQLAPKDQTQLALPTYQAPNPTMLIPVALPVGEELHGS